MGGWVRALKTKCPLAGMTGRKSMSTCILIEVRVSATSFNLWGKSLDVILEKISVEGDDWEYVPEKWIEDMDMAELGYTEKQGLLVRPEYKVALESDAFNYEISTKGGCGGISVTGQPGIGKSCFLYYLLFRLLSEKKSVAFQLPTQFLVFKEDGVYAHRLDANSKVIPKETWALSDSNNRTQTPCGAFLDAVVQSRAWIIQTTSPAPERWKQWHKYQDGELYVMKYFSKEEIRALGAVFGLNADNIIRIYETWGPSARTCVRLSRNPNREPLHAGNVSNDASRFITNPGVVDVVFDALRVIHSLFSIRPKDESPVGRGTLVAEIATNHIEDIISYAAAASQAHKRINFYKTISGQPLFSASTGQMFEKFVLSWLASPDKDSNHSLDCTIAYRTDATPPPAVEISACGLERTSFFSSLTAFKVVTKDKRIDKPLCLLPTSSTFPAIDAIVLTPDLIITIQVTISDRHDAKSDGFAKIKKSIPSYILDTCKWCHVFITDNHAKAESLRGQTLRNLPHRIFVYSAVFDVGRSDITRAHVEAFDQNKQCAVDKFMDVDDETSSNSAEDLETEEN
ncbi:hypothetical protein DFH94DRAFT_709173 [Russula ochroleuca]|uniref:Crinkler (CRN) family protein n=1 Tax=Russula ochroleuca TaxID=152965 RepID=A0A9P5N470_9AGAM|nr:hypothetical protein DFH94DRAFT_709173 [Russula ochroleuca]